MHFTEYDVRVAAYALVIDAHDQILLAWYNGKGRGKPLWTLPGGGVEYDESIEEAIVREVWEETGYHIELDAPLATNSFVSDDGPRPPRPYKSVRVIYTAHVTGGQLGTVEVDGSTDRAAWMPIAELTTHDARSPIVDVALDAWRQQTRRSS